MELSRRDSSQRQARPHPIILSFSVFLLIAPTGLYSLRISGYCSNGVCESVLWASCLAVYLAGFIFGYRMPETSRVYGKLTTVCRGIPSLLLLIIERWIPAPSGASSDAQLSDLIPLAILISTLLCAIPWLTQFSEFNAFKDVDDPFREKLSDSSVSWFENSATATSALKMENRVDMAFAYFSALALNAYNLLGGLRSLDWYLLVYILMLLFPFAAWWVLLEQWRSRTMATGSTLTSIFPAVVTLIVAFTLAAVNMVLDQNAQGAPSGDAGRADIYLFSVQVLILGLTTALPYVAAFIYKRSVQIELKAKGFVFAKNGRQYLEIDQENHLLRSERGVAPRCGQKLFFSILDETADHVGLSIRFKTRGFGKERRLVYDYSVLYEGREFYVQGLENPLRRVLVIALLWWEGRGTSKPADLARYKVENTAIDPGAYESSSPPFCLVTRGVPPIVSEGYLETAARELPPQ